MLNKTDRLEVWVEPALSEPAGTKRVIIWNNSKQKYIDRFLLKPGISLSLFAGQLCQTWHTMGYDITNCLTDSQLRI